MIDRAPSAAERLPGVADLPLLAGLPDEVRAVVVGSLELLPFAFGEELVSEGDAPDGLYFILEGAARVVKMGDGGQEVALNVLGPGDSFGEIGLLGARPRTATVRASGEVVALRMHRTTAISLATTYPELRGVLDRAGRRYELLGFLRSRSELRSLPLAVINDLLDAVEEVGAAQSEIVVREGDRPDALYLVLEGRLRATRMGDSPAPDGYLRAGDVFGEAALLCGAACVAMVCRHFGRAVHLSHVRAEVHTSRAGTTMLGLVRGAEALGLDARPLKVSRDKLDSLPLPAIVHWENNHWVVLYDTGSNSVRIADPQRGLRRLRREVFDASWSGYAVAVERTLRLDDGPTGGAGLGWLIDLLRPFRRRFALAAVFALLAAGMQMTIPLFSRVVVDRVLPHRDFALLTTVVLATAGVIALSTLITVAQRYLLSAAAVRFDVTSLDFVTARLLRLPMSYFHARRIGDIERRLAGVRQVREFAVQNGVQGLTSTTQLLVAVGVMFLTSWRLALLYLAIAPAYAALMRFSTRRLRPLFDTVEEGYGRYQSRQIDAIRGIETVKSMGAEAALRELMLAQFRELARRIFRADLTVMVYEGTIQLMTFLTLAVFLWLAALEVLDHHLTIGGLVAFNTLVLLANAPILAVLVMWDQLQYSSVLINRLNDIVDQAPEQSDETAARAVRSLSGRVELRGVGFHYGGPGAAAILSEINVTVEPGTAVAIVGRSGSGKTTLVKCLAGLLVPTDGRILYDGVDLRELDYRDLRRQLGFVLQENHLSVDSIARNIAFGDAEPELEAVIRAAKIANAHGFIQQLPLGYDTVAGETGLLLSGGQRQRIAIARAIYRDPSVLIFDEATSSLDTGSERAVQDNMDRLLQHRTSFIIAHRLSTVRDADLIVVLDRGRIVERGSHDELLARRGIYYYLTSQQALV